MSFLQNLGRGLIYGIVGISGGMVYFLPNTLFLDKVRDIMQQYKRGTSVPVSADVVNLAKSVMTEMKFTEEDQDCIDLFTVGGFGFFNAGSVWKSDIFGRMEKAIIGIPVNCQAKTLSKDLQKDILAYGESVDWQSGGGQKLEKSLLLSEKAKKFALAQRLYYVSTYEVVAKSTLTGIILNLTLVYLHMSGKFLKSRNIRRRWPFYFLLCSTKLALWILIRDGYTCYFEEKSDKVLADLGKDYVEGGLEFYESVLQTNLALRSIAQKMGRRPSYTSFGNEKSTLRVKHVTVTSRRDYFKDLNS